MARFLARKIAFYLLTFVVAVTIDWAIPRFMPGDPIQGLLARMQAQPNSQEALSGFYTHAFGLDVPLWQQYLNFWKGLFSGDLGTSVWQYPRPVSSLIVNALPYTLGLLVPAIVLSFLIGNRLGALAARRKLLDNTVLPVSYLLTATPYMWLAIVLAFFVSSVAGLLPLTGAYDYSLQPAWTWEFVSSYLQHWILPFLSLFLVSVGGWAIGMRNMVIYELESDYSNYLAALGAPQRLIRRYAYHNAILPQVTGLALALGAVVAGALVTEVVFTYPGLGTMTLTAIENRDYFLLQGIFIFIIGGVLIANFLVDVAYMLIDPRTRLRIQGS